MKNHANDLAMGLPQLRKVSLTLSVAALLGSCSPMGGFRVVDRGLSSAPELSSPAEKGEVGEGSASGGGRAERSSFDFSMKEVVLSLSGKLTPTVYYKPVFFPEDESCAANTRVPMLDVNGKVLLQTCSRIARACAVQGSCTFYREVEGGRELQTIRLNIISYNPRTRISHFADVTSSECVFGLGVRSICLDPFYSVAADLSLYKPGDVLFVPAMVGLPLPDGSLHDGFMVVRDAGGGIEGLGRFDFFTGLQSWRSPQNPFLALKLQDPSTRLDFFLLRGERAEQVRRERSYPKLPKAAKKFL